MLSYCFLLSRHKVLERRGNSTASTEYYPLPSPSIPVPIPSYPAFPNPALLYCLSVRLWSTSCKDNCAPAGTVRLVLIHTRRKQRRDETKKHKPCRDTGLGKLIVCPSAVMPGLGAVEVVALRISTLLLTGETGAETASRVRTSRGTVTLAAGPVLLIVAPVGLGLLWRDQ